MDGSHVEQLEEQIGQLRSVLRELNEDEPFDLLYRVIRNPRFTSVAEFQLIDGGLQSMTELATALNDLKRAILAGASAVGREDARQ
jgi:hypothetical protein